MALVGALSNQQEKLARLNALRRKLLKAAGPFRPQDSIPARRGAIRQAVVEVLAAAPEPMRFIEIHSAVERLLNMPVSKSTVKSCLSEGARGEPPKFERLARGLYRLRQP